MSKGKGESNRLGEIWEVRFKEQIVEVAEPTLSPCIQVRLLTAACDLPLLHHCHTSALDYSPVRSCRC